MPHFAIICVLQKIESSLILNIVHTKGGCLLNEVALVGRITKDPMLREVAGGRLQATFVLAVSRNFKNSNGQTDADFILCTLWNKLAESTAKYCGKGSLIGLAGRIQSRTYEREDGSRVYVTEVIGEKVHFITTKPPLSQTSQEQSQNEHFHMPQDEQLPIT